MELSEENKMYLDVSRKQARASLELYEAFKRLQDNKDFDLVVNEAYLRDRAVALVHMKGQTQVTDTGAMGNLDRDIDGIGSLASWFNALKTRADIARDNLINMDQLEEELTSDEETDFGVE